MTDLSKKQQTFSGYSKMTHFPTQNFSKVGQEINTSEAIFDEEINTIVHLIWSFVTFHVPETKNLIRCCHLEFLEGIQSNSIQSMFGK